MDGTTCLYYYIDRHTHTQYMYLSSYAEPMTSLQYGYFSCINPYLSLLARQKSRDTSVTEAWYTIQHRPITHVRGPNTDMPYLFFFNNGTKFEPLSLEGDTLLIVKI
jgi:hypothetical protein